MTYCGRIVAACTGACFLLADDLAYRPPGDPELVFVVMMCSYATDIRGASCPARSTTSMRAAMRARP